MKKRSSVNTRRKILTSAGTLAAAIPFVHLLGCSGTGGSNIDIIGETHDSDENASTPTNTEWLSGGTNLIKQEFPDTSIFAQDTDACTIEFVRAVDEGPCYFQVSEREDISEGLSGLPMQFCLQVIDRNCNPVPEVLVEIWHCDTQGVYSADSSESDDAGRFNTNFCSGGEAEALTARWYRGEQVTDNNGRVNFKSCFPGWYPVRAIHVHFRIRNNGLDSLVSQLGFSDSFCDEICTTHPEYKNRGVQQVSLATDGFINNNDNHLIMNIQQNTDGSLLAYKRIQLS